LSDPAWVTTSPADISVAALGVIDTLTNPAKGADRPVTVKVTPGLLVSVKVSPTLIRADCPVLTIKKLLAGVPDVMNCQPASSVVFSVAPGYV